MEIFLQLDTWVALLTLTFLEIVLGIDNIVFISITAGKLPENQVKKATQSGLFLAMILRIILLFSVSYLVGMTKPLFEIDWSWLHTQVTGQGLILFSGGLFLLYKSTSEIHHKIDPDASEEERLAAKEKKKISFSKVIVQIVLIDLVFSFDSVLTAVGMTNGVPGALTIMVIAVVISMVIMMAFATPIGRFVNKHPSVQMLALAFLILIGFMLITEAAHLSNTLVFDSHVGAIPKGYLYFAIAFSLGVEALNMRVRKIKKSK